MNIRILFMDVDGTLTDGKIYMGLNGEAFKTFNIKDGYGIHDLLIPGGIIPVIITGRSSAIVMNRCKELGITDVYQGVEDKESKLKEVLLNKGILPQNAAYIGDDLNDMACMKSIKEAGGIVGCPSDSAKQVLEFSDFISKFKGGDGAVREFIEWLTN